MIIENKFAQITFHKNYNGNKVSLLKLVKLAKEKKIKEFLIIEDLKVKDSKNFGKGYGKQIFLKTIKDYKIPILLSPSFSDCEEYKSFSGREEMSMDNMSSAPLRLLNEFYIAILNKEKIKYEINKDNLIIFP